MTRVTVPHRVIGLQLSAHTISENSQAFFMHVRRVKSSKIQYSTKLSSFPTMNFFLKENNIGVTELFYFTLN